MFTVDQKTTFVGITDLRTETQAMLKALKHSRVILTDRNAPRAVVIDYEDFEKMKELIEMAEEGMDAIEIGRRKKQAKKFLTHEQALKALSLK